MTRRQFPPSGEVELKAWEMRSSYVLGRYVDDHDATLADFGLERPIKPARIRAYLSEHCRQRRREGLSHKTEGIHVVALPDGQSAYTALPEIVALDGRARRIATELDCDPGLVVSFLLSGQAFLLPWIEIKTLHDELGPSFVIHVGSADVTAEEVRSAYVSAVRTALGCTQKRPLPTHIVPLVLKDAEGRLAGLTWRQRWQEWQRYTREWGIIGRARGRGEGDEKTGYKTVESYRNYVEKKKAQHEWIRRALDEADWQREWQEREKEGSG